MNLIPCFCNIFINFSAISLSIPGNILGRNSIISTSDPSLLQIVPISRPMTPPPITINFLGTFLSSRAPVEVTIDSSSIFILGKTDASDPVAIITLSVFIISIFPLLFISISFEEIILAVPVNLLILFLPNKKPIPLVRSSTIFDFLFNNLERSKLTSLQLIPHSIIPFDLIVFSYCSEA